MFKNKNTKNLLKLQKLKSSERSKVTRNESFESWRIDLTIIKAERLRIRIISIRRPIIAICILLLFLYSGNITAYIYVIFVNKFNPVVNITGLIYNIIGLLSLFIFERSVRRKSTKLNGYYILIIWVFLITSITSDLVLISLLLFSAWANYLANRAQNLELRFHLIDLISSNLLVIIYLILIILLLNLRNEIFQLRKYNTLIADTELNKSTTALRLKRVILEKKSIINKSKKNQMKIEIPVERNDTRVKTKETN